MYTVHVGLSLPLSHSETTTSSTVLQFIYVCNVCLLQDIQFRLLEQDSVRQASSTLRMCETIVTKRGRLVETIQIAVRVHTASYISVQITILLLLLLADNKFDI